MEQHGRGRFGRKNQELYFGWLVSEVLVSFLGEDVYAELREGHACLATCAGGWKVGPGERTRGSRRLVSTKSRDIGSCVLMKCQGPGQGNESGETERERPVRQGKQERGFPEATCRQRSLMVSHVDLSKMVVVEWPSGLMKWN